MGMVKWLDGRDSSSEILRKGQRKIKESPFGYPFMRKMKRKIKETPSGYPFMRKGQRKNNERLSYG